LNSPIHDIKRCHLVLLVYFGFLLYAVTFELFSSAADLQPLELIL